MLLDLSRRRLIALPRTTTCASWTASIMRKHVHLLCCCFTNRAVLPLWPTVHLLVAHFGTRSPPERSIKRERRDIHDALGVLHLLPRKAYNGKEEGPSHHRLINDCMHDILRVRSGLHVMRDRKVQFVESGSNHQAQTLPDTIDSHDISACVSMDKLAKGNKFMLLLELHRRGISADISILASAVSFCAVKKSLRGGMQLHALLVKVGYDLSILNGTSLISLYARCCQLENACQVFQNMPIKNTVSWTALVSGYAQDNQVEPCLQIFQLMRQSACRPNDITFATIFSVCTNHALLALGKSVHGLELRMGFDLCVHVSNAIISMYAKCGSIDEAQSIFESLACKDLVSWNSMIFGYSQHGLAEHCLRLLKEMEEEHIVPDVISFLGILSSCRHACLVEEGRRCFKTMIRLGIEPELDHYSCMVDLLGRAGLLDEAWHLIHTMSTTPNAVIWGSLLAACRMHGNIPIGIHAAEHRLKLEPGCAATHVQLANLYASIDCWSDVARMRKMMKDRGLKTNTACSWIEIGSKVYTFTAENRSKSHQVNNVLAILDCLQSHMEYKYDVLIDGLEFDDPEHFKTVYEAGGRKLELTTRGRSGCLPTRWRGGDAEAASSTVPAASSATTASPRPSTRACASSWPWSFPTPPSSAWTCTPSSASSLPTTRRMVSVTHRRHAAAVVGRRATTSPGWRVGAPRQRLARNRMCQSTSAGTGCATRKRRTRSSPIRYCLQSITALGFLYKRSVKLQLADSNPAV